jgi:hypothetical protein
MGVRNKLAKLVTIWLDTERACEEYMKEWNKGALQFLQGGGTLSGLTPPQRPNLKFPAGCPTKSEIEKRCRAFLPQVGERHRPTVIYFPDGPWSEWDEALFCFVPMLIHSDPHHLGGPCPRCGKFFLKTRRARLYCSHTCASLHTAMISTKRSRQAEHERKIQVAARSIQHWKKSSTYPTWQIFVTNKEPDISARWLTRAVNNGELTPPA